MIRANILEPVLIKRATGLGLCDNTVPFKLFLQVTGSVAFLAFAWMCLSVGIAVRRITPQTEATLADVRRLTLSLGGVSADARKIADSFKKQSEAQAQALTDTTRALTQTTRSLNRDLEKLGTTIDDLDSTIAWQNASLIEVQEDARRTLKHVDSVLNAAQPAVEAAGVSLQNVARITGDPAIEESLENIQMSTAEIGLSAAHVEGTTKDLEVAVHRATRPVPWIVHWGGFILEKGAQAAQWALGWFGK